MALLADLAALIAVVGAVQALVGWWLVCRFRAAPEPPPGELPAISVLRPLHGDEPLLETTLASACTQDYPRFQVVFGVQDPADPARAVAERVRARFPGHDIAVVVDPTTWGANRKVANLANMLPASRHDVLVIADSDVLLPPDCLRRVAAALAVPGTGLVTALYTGLPANRTLLARLGASAITHNFLPGVLLARALGRQDALGPTMALRRETLAAIGGLAPLRDHVADDHLLGRLVLARGLAVRLATTVPAAAVPETRLGALWRHELRWGRTIRALTPLAYAGSAVQYPLAWALAALALSGGAAWAVLLLAGCWVVRALVAGGIDRALGVAPVAPLALLPVRDVMSLAVLLASFGGSRVEWRGHVMHAAALGIER